MTFIGKTASSKVWHVVRAPYSYEGVNIDRETHIMSLCSLVWEVTETRRGEPTCKHCIKRSKVLRGELPDRACFMSKASWAEHRNREREAILQLPANSGLPS